MTPGVPMSNYNPEFFASNRMSEQLVSAAKERLDEIGHPHLKQELDDALFGKNQPRPDVKFSDQKGWTV